MINKFKPLEWLSFLLIAYFAIYGIARGSLNFDVVLGIILSALLFVGEKFIPERKVLTSAELAAFKLMHAELTTLKSDVSHISVVLSLKKPTPPKN